VNTSVESWYFFACFCWMCSLDIVNNDATPTVCNMSVPFSGSPVIANHTQIVHHSALQKSQETVMVTGLVCRNGEFGKFVWAPVASALQRATMGCMCNKITYFSRDQI
jgi:hypothetical protein